MKKNFLKKHGLRNIFIFLFSCGASSTKTSAANSLYEVLTQSAYQGKENKSYEVIKDNASLEKLYAAINDPQIPKVDFSKSRIVALFLGQRTSGGYAIKVKNVSEKGNKIYVTVEETKPKPGDMVTMAITNPFTIVKINSTKEIIFQ